MKSLFITRDDLFVACTECQFFNKKPCLHPKFAEYFKKKKMDGVGCVGGELKKDVLAKLQEEERNGEYEVTRLSNH